jgi:hypothetical protein
VSDIERNGRPTSAETSVRLGPKYAPDPRSARSWIVSLRISAPVAHERRWTVERRGAKGKGPTLASYRSRPDT